MLAVVKWGSAVMMEVAVMVVMGVTLVVAGVTVVAMEVIKLAGSLWSVPHGEVHQAALSHMWVVP